MKNFKKFSTGHVGIDDIIDRLRYGDNVVWQIDHIETYRQIVEYYSKECMAQGKELVYISFSKKEKSIEENENVKVYHLDADIGFERFALDVHDIIEREGRKVCYVFDCLSELNDYWATDMMLGNFFYVTCPYLFELDTIAYFALYQNRHSYNTIARIRETTQLMIDLNKVGGKLYIHPLKVWERYSSTMFLPHVQEGEQMLPLTNSDRATRFFDNINEAKLGDEGKRLDYWDKLFISAREYAGTDTREERQSFERILKLLLGSDEKILALAKRNFSLEDLLKIKARLIGSGSIGGKAAGMLLARKILENSDAEFSKKELEAHDSFYIGSDVFYSYVVQNDLWKTYLEQKKKDRFVEAAGVLGDRMLSGDFPNEIKEDFMKVLSYFGQSPMIVRSSSLLEDSFGNAFSGKYESVFCVNQGDLEERYENFLNAIKKIYASTMNKDALAYRRKRGLDAFDEQMAILIQRVSGDYHGRYFFPLVAGVAFSKNKYVWDKKMDQNSGMARLVMGLGTRAVNRTEGDYPRIMALDHPAMMPLHGQEDKRKYSQHKIDLLDIRQNDIKTKKISELMYETEDLDIGVIATLDHETNRRLRERGIEGQEMWNLDYKALINKTGFVSDLKRILKLLEKEYGYPVDTEFAANFQKDGGYKINILQCRPLQTGENRDRTKLEEDISPERIFFEIKGNFMGGNIYKKIDKVIFVDPSGYSKLPENQKFAAARLIGKVLDRIKNEGGDEIMLLGPGRWGTTTASLGIPISFSEISNVAVLCEMAFEIGGMTPELSYGSHFFQDLVEDDIFYAAIFPENENTKFDIDIFSKKRNRLGDLISESESEAFFDVIKIYDTSGMVIASDLVSQRCICYFAKMK